MELNNVSLLYSCSLIFGFLNSTCTSQNQRKWTVDVQADMSLSSNGAGSVVKDASSMIDCSAKCVEDVSCCKASFLHSAETCYLDTSRNCSCPTVQSTGSSLLLLLGESCKDIYLRNPGISDGKYIINAGILMPVYCVFKHNVTYTFLSKKINIDLVDIKQLYSINNYALIRNLNSNDVQKETIVQQLTSYASIANLSFTYNNHQNYNAPINIAPYLYLGFLPINLANQLGITQGYISNGKEFTFTNCDGNPNSYIVFYYNPNGTALSREKTSSVGTGWIDSATPVEQQSYMDEEFFFEFEVHFGGCGAIMTSASVSGTMAALGLPSTLP